ncbi:MAG: hypothetical protein H6Q05_1637 [Acidobacteria bacterium]|nr:hypothetical protein [Acidobacteriota bacterium]
MEITRKSSSWLLLLAAVLISGAMAFGQSLPTPEQFAGHAIGAEKKLVRWDKQVEYFQLVAKGSDRVLYREVGKTTENNPFVLLVISSADNLKNLERYRQINRSLFDPRTIASDQEAGNLVQEGKVFVLVTCSIHASEIGANQMTMEAVHRLATENTPTVRAILDNVVFLLVPSLNPDGQIMVIDWYNKTLGTPYEGSSMPWLYHKYVGHDNNRDAYMFTQKESQLIGRILYQDWLPEVWLDMHQMGNSGARIFVMPAMDPINPNVDPLVYRNTGLLGFAQGAALERAGKEGIIYGEQYTYWWEGAMAWTGWWHNMAGLLTEVASVQLATSVEVPRANPVQQTPGGGAGRGGQPAGGRGAQPGGRGQSGPSDVQFRSNYPRPWLGGRWTLRDIVDYDEIAAFGLLETTANLRTQLLDSLYVIGKRQIELGRKGEPYAIVVPLGQSDPPTAVKLLQTLALGGVEVHQAQATFSANSVNYPPGTYVILMSQPFRPYAKDMLEAQVYPQISPAPGQPARAPYDVAGWSLGMQMGVDTVFVNRPFEANLKKLETIELPPGNVSGQGAAFLLSHAPNNSLVAVNRLLKSGYEVSWLTAPAAIGGKNYPAGTIVVRGGKDLPAAVAGLAKSLGIDATAADAPAGLPALRIRSPRTALYQPWGGNMDEGWTRWLLEQNEFPIVTIHPEDLREGNASGKFDAVVFPDMSSQQILNGQSGRNVMEQYRGGIGDSGLKALRSFIENGGSVITIGRSSSLMLDRFAAPYRDGLRGLSRQDFFCPGSVLRVLVDNTHPIAYGMEPESNSYFANSMVLEPAESFATMNASIIVQYPTDSILKSGWLQGETYLYNKVGVAEVKLGKGRMVLMPLKVQQRAQPYATFKLLFNAILTSAAN